jgi:hypothetical protein
MYIIFIVSFIGSLIFFQDIFNISSLIFDSIPPDERYLDFGEKMINNVIIIYNKMSLMLNPKLQIVSYNCIYYFSLLQIKFNIYLEPYLHKLFENCLTYIGYNDDPTYVLYITYSFYKNGLPIESGFLKQDELISDILEPDEYDLFTVSLNDYDKKSDIYFSKNICFNKKILINSINFVDSHIKFLNIVLKYNGNEYEIKLKDEGDNFYITGSIIDLAFFKYYLRYKMHVENVDYENFKYGLYLLDHNVNRVELDESDAIIIKEDGYEVIKLTNLNVNRVDEASNQENKLEVLSDNFEDDFDKLE